MPHSRFGRALKQPFVKFICHSASYVLFLCKFYFVSELPAVKKKIIFC